MGNSIADRPATRRFLRGLGTFMRVFGVFGILVSLLLALGLLFLPARLIPAVSEAAASTADGLREISRSMAQASTGILSAAGVLDTAGAAVLEIAESVENTKPLIESAAGIVGNVGRKSLEETRQALDAAHAAAQAVDTVLRTLSLVGSITGITYDPERSLNAAIQDVASGLEPLPGGLIEVSDRLYDTAEGFDDVSNGLNRTGADIQGLSGELRQLGQSLEKLSGQLDQQASNLDGLVERVPLIIWTLVGAVELLLVGFVLAQVSVVRVGAALYRENAEAIV